jgi:ComF family protein
MWDAGRELMRGAADLLVPPKCLCCGGFMGESALAEDDRVCAECRAGFASLPEAHCRQCAQPFESDFAGHLCGACLAKPPPFDAVWAAGLYDGPLKTAIHRFKYERYTALARPLADFMDRVAARRSVPEWDLLLPVPLHPKRLKQRGFNQALLLARACFGRRDRPIRYDVLIRSRFTSPQVELAGEARRKNVRGAFRVVQPEVVAGGRIAVIDDVYTTGATAADCARALKKAGAALVVVVAAARVN